MEKEELPEQLKELIDWSISLFADSVKEEYGTDFYKSIEETRQNLLREWSGNHLEWKKDVELLRKEYSKFEGLSSSERLIFAHTYTCMLELINRCESAYRSYRLAQHDQSITGKSDNWIIFVLTAHPTEARGPEFLAVFNRIAEILVQLLEERTKELTEELYHLLRIILKVPIARSTKPEVVDEARSIYNYALKPDILALLVRVRQAGTNVLLRTWVGGDKDGHPGVDENTMVESFQLSRHDLLIFIKRRLHKIQFELDMMRNLRSREKLAEGFSEIKEMATALEELRDTDGERVVEFRRRIREFKESYEEAAVLKAQPLQDVLDLIWLFPALVLPLEVREDSELVAASLEDPSKYAIGRMLASLDKIAKGNDPKWYVRGFVLSMCEETQDMLNGIKLVEMTLGKQVLPVVPLFETEKALVNGTQILDELFEKKPDLIKLHHDLWGGRFEVMLGYSDSSKESGVLASRILISKSMNELDRKIDERGLTPVFFHGSGGSVARGGGSIREQTQWWPKSAIRIFKATIQGEMVARTFATPEIFHREIQKISVEWTRKRVTKPTEEGAAVLEEFAKMVQKSYQAVVADSEFLKVVEKASPYMFLSHLKIGSRPTKRTSELKIGGLRAIPWILCWTQTRVLFPTWWGVGSSWKEFGDKKREILKESFQSSHILRSYVKILGFTLEKVELAVWRMYLEESGLPEELYDKIFQRFIEEYSGALTFCHEVTQEDNLLWYRPWLKESIEMRSPMAHPLNLLQLLAVKNDDGHLLRKTVTGIACGMLTTG